jgi:1-acyl-sn-glycerol-3-phosphate acyltransferase
MRFIRSVAFYIAFYVWGILAGVVFLPTLAMRPVTVRLTGAWWSGTIIWLAKVICGIGWEVRGLANVPAGPVIFASKHQSAWDTLFFPAFFDQPSAVAKSELRAIPFYGWYSNHAGAIWVDRKAGGAAIRAMIRGARRTIGEGRPIFIFPQGTRTRPGETWPYQPGVAALYAGAGVPVVPVALNSGLFWGRRSFLKQPGTIVVECLPPIPPGLDRAAFMAALEQAIETATARLEAEAGTPAPTVSAAVET